MNCILNIILTGVIIILVMYIIYTNFENNKQNKRRIDILKKVIDGNLNSRILADPNSKSSQLDFLINNLINLYQKNIIEFHKNEEKRKQLLSNISHDVRTPLTSIIGYLDAIQNSLISSSEEKEKYINISNNKAKQLKTTLDDIFELARSEANEIILDKRNIDINRLIKDILIDFIPMFEKRGIELINNIQNEEDRVLMDEYSLKRAIQNILMNALQHGSDGGVIGVATNKENNEYKIEIWDKGLGIDKKEIEKIFLRLHKYNNSAGNYGLGLAIAKSMIEKNNGRINVKSIPNVKTSFEVYLKSNDI